MLAMTAAGLGMKSGGRRPALEAACQCGKYRPEDANDEIDIRARYTEPYRNLQELSNLRVQTPGGSTPVSNFVERKAAPAPEMA